MKSRPIFTARALLRALRRLPRPKIARLGNIARTIVFWLRKIILQIASFATFKTMSPHFSNTRSDFEYLCWFLLISGFSLAIGVGIIGDILGGISESIAVGFLYVAMGFGGLSLMSLGFLITMASLGNIWASLYRWITKASNQQKNSRGRNQSEYGYSGNSSDHSRHERTNTTHKTDHEQAAEILDIPPNTSFAKAKKSYRKLMMKHHPDRGGDEERTKSLTWAMRVFEKHRNSPEDEFR